MKVEVVRETHDTPAWAQSRLTLAGGLNPYGEPVYRAVWGWNRLAWIGGHWGDVNRDIPEWFGMAYEPKYTATASEREGGGLTFNRWFIEKWMGPERYGSPEIWDWATREWENDLEHTGNSVLSLGPYPSRGDWEMSMVIENPVTHDFIQLEPMIVDYLARVIEYGVNTTSKAQRMAALRRREVRKELDARHRDNETLGELTPIAFGKSNVSMRPTPRNIRGGGGIARWKPGEN